MTEAGVELGLDRPIAAELAAQTAYGAGLLLHESEDDAAVLRANVTSPNGTTAAAIASFDAQDVRGAFATAKRACRDRSAELGRAPG
jgi:pyrroline-5-carboxylate reductase